MPRRTYFFDHEQRSNRGLKNCLVVLVAAVVVVQAQYFHELRRMLSVFNLDMSDVKVQMK